MTPQASMLGTKPDAAGDPGNVGCTGNTFKNVLPIRTREHSLVVDKRFIGRRRMPVHYRMRLAL